MAPFIRDATIDLLLADLATATLLCLCSAEPTTYAEASSTYKLADHVLTPGDGNGDFVIADDTSGRKLTMAAQTPITVDSTGTITHLALCISGSSTLLYVTALASGLAVTAAGEVSVPELKITNAKDPVTS